MGRLKLFDSSILVSVEDLDSIEKQDLDEQIRKFSPPEPVEILPPPPEVIEIQIPSLEEIPSVFAIIKKTPEPFVPVKIPDRQLFDLKTSTDSKRLAEIKAKAALAKQLSMKKQSTDTIDVSKSVKDYLDGVEKASNGIRLFSLRDTAENRMMDTVGRVVYFASKSSARIVRDQLLSIFGISTYVTKGPDHGTCLSS